MSPNLTQDAILWIGPFVVKKSSIVQSISYRFHWSATGKTPGTLLFSSNQDAGFFPHLRALKMSKVAASSVYLLCWLLSNSWSIAWVYGLCYSGWPDKPHYGRCRTGIIDLGHINAKIRNEAFRNWLPPFKNQSLFLRRLEEKTVKFSNMLLPKYTGSIYINILLLLPYLLSVLKGACERWWHSTTQPFSGVPQSYFYYVKRATWTTRHSAFRVFSEGCMKGPPINLRHL